MRAKDSLVSGSVAGLAIFLFVVFPLTTQAGGQPTFVVDGQYDEWDLEKDCSTSLHNGQGYAEETLPKVYLHYDNIANTVFVLVLQKEGIKSGMDAPVVNIYSLGHHALPAHLNGAGKMPNFSWVMEGTTRVGWEGAFQVNPGASYQCDARNSTRQRHLSSLKKKKASEVEVIDTEELLLNCN
jgi:hypothetical protein